MFEDTIGERFKAICQEFPDRIAVKTPRCGLSYAELNGQSDALAVAFLELGLVTGDPVAISLGNCAEYAVVRSNMLSYRIVVLKIQTDCVCVLQNWSNRRPTEPSIYSGSSHLVFESHFSSLLCCEHRDHLAVQAANLNSTASTFCLGD